jgi:hypothetical protein
MSNVTCKAYKHLGNGFSNEVCHEKLTWNFSDDGGTNTDVFRMGIADRKILITNAIVQVETACVGSSSTGAVGTTTAAEAFLTASHGAVTSLTDDATFKETAGQLIVVPAGDYFLYDIGTANMTAGKVNLFIDYVNAA